MRVVVSGLVGTYPVGGMAFHYLQYLLGFRRLGWEVLYLEDTGQWTYSPSSGTFVSDPRSNLEFLAAVLERFDLGEQWAFRDHKGLLHGPVTEGRLREQVQGADLFLNVSGACWLRDEYRCSDRPTVYIDTDPGFNQIKVNRHVMGDDDPDLAYSVDRMAEHSHHATFGLNLGARGCKVPLDLFDWIPTRQPIDVDLWGPSAPPTGEAFTTVLSWKPYSESVRYQGREYWGKIPAFDRVREIPHVVGAKMELAISGEAPREELKAMGWLVRDAEAVSGSIDDYRKYIRSSLGEFSPAKDLYVDLATGWFSERSACYLAAGRPVVVEETGFSPHLPENCGVISYTEPEEAIAGIEEVTRNYAKHAGATRVISEEFFRSDRVLSDLMAALGLPGPSDAW